ncbi:MAG: hypothetical protein K2M75_00810 [Clostridia bacterium]|nr:hypothetical protein [Clostridia bacterium]
MRKLTIKRKWSIIECGSKIHLYVQCSKDDAVCKHGEDYFKHFDFKNGKSVEVEIWNEETKVLVVSSTMEVSYAIPAGENDANLIASPKYSPLQGNPFIIQEVK